MKIKNDYVLQNIADEYLVVPIGEESDRLHGIIKLNEAGAFLWKNMVNKSVSKEEAVNILIRQYNVDPKTALNDVEKFIEQLVLIGCIE